MDTNINNKQKNNKIVYFIIALGVVMLFSGTLISILKLSSNIKVSIAGVSDNKNLKKTTSKYMTLTESYTTSYINNSTISFKLSQNYGAIAYYWVDGPKSDTNYRKESTFICRSIKRVNPITVDHKVSTENDNDYYTIYLYSDSKCLKEIDSITTQVYTLKNQ